MERRTVDQKLYYAAPRTELQVCTGIMALLLGLGVKIGIGDAIEALRACAGSHCL
jgi:hypothetical protein